MEAKKDPKPKKDLKRDQRLKGMIFFLMFSLASGMSFAAVNGNSEDNLQNSAEENFIPGLDKFSDKLINLGVVVQNDNYTIYRSSLLGKKGLNHLEKTLAKRNLPFPKTIIYMNKEGYSGFIPMIGNFAIEEFKAQREYGFRFYHSFDYKYRTYVDGHNPYEPKEDIDSQGYLLGKEARRIFGAIEDNQNDGGIEAFLRVLDIVLDKERQPVLFHCFGGRHRTGMVAMALRYMQGGDWVEGPTKDVHISTLGKTLSLNPAQYEYYQHNKEMVREENFEFIEQFSQDPRFLELKDKYSGQL